MATSMANRLPDRDESAILDEAIAWMMKLHSGKADADTRDACMQWRRSDPRHERIWQRLQATEQDFNCLVASDAATALRTAPKRQSRRALLKVMGVGVTVGGVWGVYGNDAWLRWRADQSTAVGQRRHVELTDQVDLWLNTDTAVDFPEETPPRVILRAGEVCVDCRDARAVRIDTPYGRFQATDARYTVRLVPDAIRLWVARGVVDVSPSRDRLVQVQSPANYRIDAHGLHQQTAPHYDPAAWADGVLDVRRMPLADFVAELDRYWPGWLSCDPDVGAIQVSGVYRLNDISQVLSTLSQALPVRVRRLTRYWVRVVSV